MPEIEPEPGRAGREYLSALLSERNQHPERADAIDKKIRAAFERKVAILALDMCGFSELTDKYGSSTTSA